MKRALLLIVLLPNLTFSECITYADLNGYTHIANEFGTSIKGVKDMNYKINLWSKSNKAGKGKVISKLVPGSRVKVIESFDDELKVVKPFSGKKESAWISKVQVAKTYKEGCS